MNAHAIFHIVAEKRRSAFEGPFSDGNFFSRVTKFVVLKKWYREVISFYHLTINKSLDLELS